LPAKSKIPPEFEVACLQVLQVVVEGVELFSFHDSFACLSGLAEISPSATFHKTVIIHAPRFFKGVPAGLKHEQTQTHTEAYCEKADDHMFGQALAADEKYQAKFE
jgi:hypothetical protein